MREIVIFPCCAGKEKRYWEYKGQKVEFVANPDKCAKLGGFLYCHPDCKNPDTGKTWRQELEDYNKQYQLTGKNPLGLCRAWELYQPKQNKTIYAQLYKKFGERLFILSAGWGLVRADYLLPHYDITFGQRAKPYNERRENDTYYDFNQLIDVELEKNDIIYFFGVKGYIWLYYRLTCNLSCRKVIYHRSTKIHQIQGYEYMPYSGGRRTSWHYSCIKDLWEASYLREKPL